MATLARSTALIFLSTGLLWFVTGRASAQAPAPATAAFPIVPGADPAPAAVPAPAAAPTPAVTPTPAPASTPAPLAPGSAPPSRPAYPEPQPYGQAYPQREAYPAGPPPPPPQDPNQGFKMPEISVRIDPFNLLLEGRMGLELEVALYPFLTLELVPVFVTSQSPPMLNYSTYEKASLHQESNGWGPMSGTAIDAGFWFGGKPFRGYVLRTGLTNYAYTYKTTAPANDTVSHTDRQLFVMVGSHNRWGAFTLAAGFGLAYELNRQNRCFDDFGNAGSSCEKDQLLIKLNQDGTSVANLQSYLYPFDLLARISIGVVF